MNEKIKGLLEKATIKDHWSVDENRYLTHFVDQEKFAELVITEAVLKIYNHPTLYNDPNYKFEKLLSEIKQDLGVQV